MSHATPAKDLTGHQFGRLKVVRFIGGPYRSYTCMCDCGTETAVATSSFTRPRYPTRSCGCLQREKNRKHGGSTTHEYQAWIAMRRRCCVPTAKAFNGYGGRGIRVCPEWMNSFAQFIKDMGLRPSSQHSLERRDNNGNYEPGNCYWATWTEQQRNTRRTHLITHAGRTQCIAAWAEELGIPRETLGSRLRRARGSIAQALEAPVQMSKSRAKIK